MANHCAAAAAALLLIASLLVAVILSGADARPTVLPDKMSSAVLGGGNHDAHGRGLADGAAAAVFDPECDDDDEEKPKHHKNPKHHGDDNDDEYPDDKHHGDDNEDEYPDHKHHGDDDEGEYPDTPMQPEHTEESPYPEADAMEQELCSECELPKMPPPPPPCNTCDEPKEPELKCNKVHPVRDGETCNSVGQCAGLGQEDFLRYNPNLCCDNLFVGQWVCLEATCDA